MDVNSFLKSRVKPTPVSAEPSTVTEGEQRGTTRKGRAMSDELSMPPADRVSQLVGVPEAAPSPSSATVYSDTTPSSSEAGGGGAVVYSDVTPAGIRVTYTPGDGTKENPRQYTVNDVVVPSVTTVLDVLRKDGLSWWGMKVGVEGVLSLIHRERFERVVDWMSPNTSGARTVLYPAGPKTIPPNHVPATVENIVSALTEEKLTVNHALNKAGDRGTSVHDALEKWAQSGGAFFPTPQNYSEEERPYVEGLLAFIDQFNGSLKPVRCEVMVGSAEHGFAGRYDLDVELWEPTEVIVKAYKKRKSKTEVVQPGVYKLDLKTSSGVYDSHHLQLAAYELACIECGYPKSDAQYVLHVTKEGQHELVKSNATAEQFLAVKGAYDALRSLK